LFFASWRLKSGTRRVRRAWQSLPVGSTFQEFGLVVFQQQISGQDSERFSGFGKLWHGTFDLTRLFGLICRRVTAWQFGFCCGAYQIVSTGRIFGRAVGGMVGNQSWFGGSDSFCGRRQGLCSATEPGSKPEWQLIAFCGCSSVGTLW